MQLYIHIAKAVDSVLKAINNYGLNLKKIYKLKKILDGLINRYNN